jgi:hypothetical protein
VGCSDLSPNYSNMCYRDVTLWRRVSCVVHTVTAERNAGQLQYDIGLLKQ